MQAHEAQRMDAVKQVLTQMAQVQTNAGRPLAPTQYALMRTHLIALYSGTLAPSQEELTNHLAALLRSFQGASPPPLPQPAGTMPVPVQTHIPGATPPAGTPAPSMQAALMNLLRLHQGQQGAGGPQMAGLATLMNLMRPAAPRYGFTDEQKEVLRLQILVFRKMKRSEAVSPDELDPRRIKPPPLQPQASAMNPQAALALQSLLQRAQAGQGAAQVQAARAPTPNMRHLHAPLVQQRPAFQQQQQRLGLPQQRAMLMGALPAALKPGMPPRPTREQEALPRWRCPPPQEYRGVDVVARPDGPLMSLTEMMSEEDPRYKVAQTQPQVQVPQWQQELSGLMQREVEQALSRNRKRRLEEVTQVLGIATAAEADAWRVTARLPAPKRLCPSAPAIPSVSASAPTYIDPSSAAARPVALLLPDVVDLTEEGPMAGVEAAGAGLEKPQLDMGALAAAGAVVDVHGSGSTAAEGLAVELKQQLVPGFAPGPEGQRARGSLMLELRKLRLLELQTRLRKEVETDHIHHLSLLPEQEYKHLAKRLWSARKDELKERDISRYNKTYKTADEVTHVKLVLAERQVTLDKIRKDRNKAVQRLHDKFSRDLMRKQGDDGARRMEMLRNNDLTAYQEEVNKQRGQGGEEDMKFQAISKFLNETEDYLVKLAARLAQLKVAEEAQAYVQQVMEEARRGGASQDEIVAAGIRAAQEAERNSEITRSFKSKGTDAQTRYYELAHSVREEIITAPSLLKPPMMSTGEPGSLREYQMIGLRWMVSLYNNKLNGILADEMGLGKTVQVMALIAYLMEHKFVYGPHLIIVPNAVLVNWKSELQTWLPGVKCVYYVGNKDERNRKFITEVATKQFNVLVTTYEFIMRDISKLKKIQWEYIIIDEAQRLKERESKLSKDIDKFPPGRRLLLTGTPLQNELRELWNLLNLLLPEVFDDKQQFGQWFETMLQEDEDDDDDKPGKKGAEQAQLATEKKLVVVHRLHQILMPFMLRRQVQDVEGKLPLKVAVVVKVPMTPYQSAVYNWIRLTGTLKLRPDDPARLRLHRDFASLNNKVMELRKVCNHPLLSYPMDQAMDEELMQQCGKLLVLDRLLVKFKQTGHRVLLFCTMTKLLDLLEVYLKYRKLPDGTLMQYRRIDGTTPLEQREIAIQDFNRPDTEVFIFLLSIRAAGRGLNLQTSDTVVIYDPDPNPKNEEQAIARSHRIGQKKEVRVIHLETVTDPVNPKKGSEACVAELTRVLEEAEEAGTKPRYFDSVESLVRNLIQKQKIDMANEVIDAGRFDGKTTMDERRNVLENLLQDEDRSKVAQNEVLDWHQLNALVARGPDELELFDDLDETMDWPGQPPAPDDPNAVPPWLTYTSQDVDNALKAANKKAHITGILAVQDGTVRKKSKKGAGPAFGMAKRDKSKKGKGGRGGARGGKAKSGGGGGGGFGRARGGSMSNLGVKAGAVAKSGRTPAASRAASTRKVQFEDYNLGEDTEEDDDDLVSEGSPTAAEPEVDEDDEDDEELEALGRKERALEEEEDVEGNLVLDDEVEGEAGPSNGAVSSVL